MDSGNERRVIDGMDASVPFGHLYYDNKVIIGLVNQ